MKKLLLTLSALAFVLSGFSQLHVEVNYPYHLKGSPPEGSGMISQRLDGVFDIGAGYRFLEFGKFNGGISLNYSFQKLGVPERIYVGPGFGGGSSNVDDFKVKYGTLQPRFFTEYDAIEKFKPSLGIGYSLLTKSYPEVLTPNGTIEAATENSGGPSIAICLPYLIDDNLFIQGAFNYQSFGKNENINMIKGGFGYRFNK